MKNVTGNDRRMAEHDDRRTPDAGPGREDIRGVADDTDDFDEGSEEDLEEDDDEESF
jgi:hypothetical protein